MKGSKINTSMTFDQCIKLRNALVAENDPRNKDLIEYYNRKLNEAFAKAYSKALK